MKISTFIVTILVAGLFATIFANFYAGVATTYTDYGYDTSDLLAYNEFSAVSNTTRDMESTLFSNSTGGSTLENIDLVGKFLGSAFNVFKIATQSVQSFYNIAKLGATSLGFPGYFFDITVVIVLVLILFIIISALIGKDV